ncbi:MAG: DUF885 domain-containing protein [Chloroflexi bacterium]|nr:DUF885 domain-containing protein [Chloroflexota bacterium]
MTTKDSTPSQHFAVLADRVLADRWEAYPPEAAVSGLHEFDGILHPVTEQSIAARVRQLRTEIDNLDAITVDVLTDQDRFDRQLISLGLRYELFELTDRQGFRRDPMALMGPLEATNYMDRSYAPVEQRMASMARLLHAVPAYVASIQALLQPPFAKPVLSQAIEAYEGVAGFYRGDLMTFATANLPKAQADDMAEAVGVATDAIDAFAAYLKTHVDTANNDFAIGAADYAKMLSLGEMVDMPLADIEAAGERELKRNQALVREAAERIAPGKPLPEAIAVVTHDHPTAERLLEETREMLEEIRSFTIDHNVASVISEVRAQVKETPAFMRWAFAAMDGPGPFEEVATESFYYVTPVEPEWSAEQAEEWLSNFNYSTLRIISVHEVYPGHYVHFLRHHNAPSAISKVFGAYSFWEGWAHYCEEMFLEAGYGDGDPKLQLAEAQEALIRICRLLCSLRMHTQGQTLDEAGRFFQENAYMEELPAQKEALRGTFDPGYLNYTLGKLLIYKLRADWQAEQGNAYSLQAFHDELLSHGGPPVALLRQHMLKNDNGDLL